MFDDSLEEGASDPEIGETQTQPLSYRVASEKIVVAAVTAIVVVVSTSVVDSSQRYALTPTPNTLIQLRCLGLLDYPRHPPRRLVQYT